MFKKTNIRLERTDQRTTFFEKRNRFNNNPFKIKWY